MALIPIETRYRTEIAELFEEEFKLRQWMRVEVALARAHASLGHIPKSAASEIEAASSKVQLARVHAIEAEIHHDLMAMVRALSEACPRSGGYVHLGATSYDIEDTALGMTLRDAGNIIKSRVTALRVVLKKLALEHANTVCVGRTHGQHAVPTTYGMKFALYYSALGRHKARLDSAISRVSVGKMSGATGTMATFGPDAFKLQQLVMADLGLTPAPITTQILGRDRHAELLFSLALIASTIEQIAQEIRHLQRTEIGEVAEAFASRQVASSTMPQKRNPHKSERLCSLARLVRAQVPIALENIASEHERDLTNSADERYLFPTMFCTTDYMLLEITSILSGLQFFPAAIERNLALTKGGILAERVMMALSEKGMGRQDAHELMRTAAREAGASSKSLPEILAAKAEVTSRLKAEELTALFDAHTYIGQAPEIVKKAVAEEP
ncbi:Argininosuccinate lyase [uncultured archaeon]|nr:Argininosuccinate lyase [uncultured archaeon]